MRRMLSKEQLKKQAQESINAEYDENGVLNFHDPIHADEDISTDGKIKVANVSKLTDLSGNPLQFGGLTLYRHKITLNYNEVEYNAHIISKIATQCSEAGEVYDLCKSAISINAIAFGASQALIIGVDDGGSGNFIVFDSDGLGIKDIFDADVSDVVESI